MRTSRQRFEEKYMPITETGCWIWMSSIGSHGYGQINIDGKPVLAHRFSYEIHNGPIPEGEGYHGMCVLHKCDVGICVNPDHLFLGSNKDNIDDMMRKGRHTDVKGEAHGRAKITEGDVIAIRGDTRDKNSISDDYPISANQIRLIQQNKSWKHVVGSARK